jgi:hypothetical protein
MSIASQAVMSWLLLCAVPSVGLTQVLTPFGDVARFDTRLDHVVPVAAAAYLDGPIALTDARPVADPPDEPFVLGSATLDLRDPSHAKVVFTMKNATERPIPWNTVELQEVRGGFSEDYGRFAFACSMSARADRYGAWEPGATVTVQIPIAPNCMKGLELYIPRAVGRQARTAALQRAAWCVPSTCSAGGTPTYP